MTQRSCMTAFEKRSLDRELRQIGLSGEMANAATRVASKHVDVALESRRMEWVRTAVHLSFINHQQHDQQPQTQEVEG